jgi:hypothetical protein
VIVPSPHPRSKHKKPPLNFKRLATFTSTLTYINIPKRIEPKPGDYPNRGFVEKPTQHKQYTYSSLKSE